MGSNLFTGGSAGGRLLAIRCGRRFAGRFHFGLDSLPDTPRRGQARKQRLLALVNPGRNILKIYFTDAHYTLGEWKQLQFP